MDERERGKNFFYEVKRLFFGGKKKEMGNWRGGGNKHL